MFAPIVSIRASAFGDNANGSGLMRHGIRSSAVSTLKSPDGIASYRKCAWSRAVRFGEYAVQAIVLASTAVGNLGHAKCYVEPPHYLTKIPRSHASVAGAPEPILS